MVRPILTCYQSASSRVTGDHFLTQKCFSEENLIIVSLNTVIPIIVIVKLRGWTGGGGGTGIEGAESGVEVAESGVEGAGSGSRGGGKRGNCGRGSGKIGGRNCFFY